MLHGSSRVRVLLLSCLTLGSLLFLWQAFNHKQPAPLLTTESPDKAYFPPTPGLCYDELRAEDLCASFPRHLLDDVQITIKTGIGERALLEAVLNTYASCISNLIIVSDASFTIQGHEARDVLADLPASYADDNLDWTVYKEQNAALAAGQNIEKTLGAWKLDRFKFLPMIEHTYARQPNAKWYVFIETDTYMFWDTLFRLLDRLDHNDPHYLGEAMVGAWDRWFAYGGSGFIISQGVLGNLTLTGDQRVSVKYEALVKDDCCGDAILAYVLHGELDVRLGNMYPSFSGDEPHWVAVTEENWCRPLLSLHRLKAESLESVWRWERCRASADRALTFAGFFDYELAPILGDGSSTRSNWDNGAGIEQRHIKSAEACFADCENTVSCLQASWAEGKCRFGKKLRGGRAVETEFDSSWDVKKLEKAGWQPGVDKSSVLCSETAWQPPKVIMPPKDWAQYFGFKEWPEPVPEGWRNSSRQDAR